MIDYILLVCVVFTNASLSLFNSFFQKKNGEKVGATQLYNLVMISSVFVTWSVIWALEGGFSLEVIPYSIIFGVRPRCAFDAHSSTCADCDGYLGLLLLGLEGVFARCDRARARSSRTFLLHLHEG